MVRLISSLLGLVLASNASASVFLGNPATRVQVEFDDAVMDSGYATIDRIVVEYCNGTEEVHDVGSSIDPSEGFTFVAGTGLACALRVEWSSNVELDGTASAGPFGVESWDLETVVPLDSWVQDAPMQGWSVTSGTAPAGAPRVVVSFE